MTDDDIKRLLERTKRIAVIGLSSDPGRPSHGVARSLQGFGYEIVPVNPRETEVLGEKSYPDLASVPGDIDLVDVFRAPEHVPGIVDACIERGVPALWLQEGVVHEDAAQRARDAGIEVVMDRCVYKEYRRLM
ncbi:CoA-binding protein [Salinisphaera sp. PC39]|uniref:CoA-binding protein n=1 Tax=Salinisphaera sp. PC39 TaxID=1304156 RepID=UPI003341863F